MKVLKPQCPALTRDGYRCQNSATEGQPLCWIHWAVQLVVSSRQKRPRWQTEDQKRRYK
jgi:hypothetical protein